MGEIYLFVPTRCLRSFSLLIGLGIFPALPLSAGLQSKLRLKWVILLGFVLVVVGTVLLPFGNSEDRYFSILLGTAGAALIVANTKSSCIKNQCRTTHYPLI